MDLNEIERHISEFHSTLTVLNEPSIVNQNSNGFSLFSTDNSPYGYMYHIGAAPLKFRLLFYSNPIVEINLLNEGKLHICYIVNNEYISHMLHITDAELFMQSTLKPVLDPDILVLVHLIFDHFEKYKK